MEQNQSRIRVFAYGSNMDKDDLDKWCRKKHYPVIEYSNVTPAKLKDFKLTFNYFSYGRTGGAANIMEAKSNSVYGVLVDVKNSDLKAIREKEGCPNYYHEIEVDVVTFEGRVITDVKTYKVVKEKEENQHVEPTKEYLELIIRNAIKYNFPEDYTAFLRSITSQ